jgi:hypothetical protein
MLVFVINGDLGARKTSRRKRIGAAFFNLNLDVGLDLDVNLDLDLEHSSRMLLKNQTIMYWLITLQLDELS